MRIFHELVFDEFIEGTGLLLTRRFWMPVTGAFETGKLFVVADFVSGSTVALSVQIDESPELNVIQNTIGLALSAVALTPGQTNTFTAALSTPLSYGLQLLVWLTGTSPKAHVRMWLTGRDTGRKS